MGVPFGALFDMDGVIVDTNPLHKLTILKFCHLHGLSPDDDYMEQHVYGKINREWIPALFGHHLSITEIQKLADEKEQLFREMYAPVMQPVQGLLPFLHSLRDHDIPIALATSAPPENADFVLDGLHIRPLFSGIIHSGHVSFGKPHPEVYLKAAQSIAMLPERCLVFEDSLAGIAAGLAAGCKVIGVTTTHEKQELQEAQLAVEDFTQIDLPTCQQLFTS